MFTEEGTAISAVLDGEAEAFQPLYEQHRNRLFYVILGLVSDEDLAEELTQEAFLRAYSHLDGFRDEALFSTWLVQIGIHLARDANRRKRRRGAHLPLDNQLPQSADGYGPKAFLRLGNPEQCLFEKEIQAILQTAINRLPREFREILVWKYFRDWSFAEIAEVTGVGVGALKVRAHRARQGLRRELLAQKNQSLEKPSWMA